jgi:hypothetical protein
MDSNLMFCPVCKRNVYAQDMTLHHWKPKSQGGTHDKTIPMCTTCHSVLHYVIPINQVERFRTPQSLECHWIYANYLRWIRKKTHPNSYRIKKIIDKFLTNKMKIVVKKQFKYAA